MKGTTTIAIWSKKLSSGPVIIQSKRFEQFKKKTTLLAMLAEVDRLRQ